MKTTFILSLLLLVSNYVLPCSHGEDLVLRIYHTTDNKNAIAIKKTGAGLINNANREPFLLVSQLNTNLEIRYKKGDNETTITWKKEASGKDALEKFIQKVCADSKGELAIEQLNDPALYYCVRTNAYLTIRIYYEHRIVADGEYDQKYLEARCFVDRDGTISLPPFFETISQNVTIDRADEHWQAAQTNSGKLKITRLNGKKSCTSYYEAERMITEFYYNRIGDKPNPRNIVVKITMQ